MSLEAPPRKRARVTRLNLNLYLNSIGKVGKTRYTREVEGPVHELAAATMLHIQQLYMTWQLTANFVPSRSYLPAAFEG